MIKHLCAAVLLLFMFAPDAARAQAAAENDVQEVPLAQERWREMAFGLSLRPPEGAARMEHTDDGALARFILPDGTVVTVFMRHNPQAELNLNTLRQQAMVEVSYGSRQALHIDDQVVRPAGRPGFLMYFEIENQRTQARSILGQAMMKIDPHTVAVFQLQCAVADLQRYRQMFEAILESVEMAPLVEIERVRKAWVDAGSRWYEGVDRETLLAAMTHDQWFRVVEGDRDVGYRRIRHSLANTMGMDGIRVDVMSRIISDGFNFDTESFCFLSNDRESEIWSVRITQHAARKPQGLPGSAAPPLIEQYIETGLRSGDAINVKRSLPGNVTDRAWEMPPKGYISQVELFLLPALFPRDEQRDFAFYAYNSTTGDLTLHKFSTFPLQGGGYIVREQPAPDQGEHVATFAPTGRLERRDLPEGRAYIPATPDEMKSIWNVR